jgi:hypothetical protein
MKGHYLYLAFNRTIRLDEVMWQQGQDEVSIRFRAALSQLRLGKLEQESWELLCTRVGNKLSPNEIASFAIALRLYFTNEEVRE